MTNKFISRWLFNRLFRGFFLVFILGLSSLSLAVDTDSDGIEDSSDLDDDSDGYSDGDEVNLNSDPLDANSIPIKGLPIWLLKATKDKMEQDATN